MTTAIRLILAALVLMVHVLSLPPLLAAADLAPHQATAETSDCCPSPPDPEAETSETPEDCCPEGCRRCPLSCCGGVPALVGESPAGLTGPTTTAVPPTRTRPSPTAIAPGAVDHPPRG